MEYLIIFVGAVAAAILIFDLMNALTQSALGGRDWLNFGPSRDVDRTLAVKKRSSLDAILIAVWPERFDPDRAASIPDVVDLLRRAGYPYETPGEFYAAAVRDFAMFLIVGAALAAIMTIFDMGFVGPIIAAVFHLSGFASAIFAPQDADEKACGWDGKQYADRTHRAGDAGNEPGRRGGSPARGGKAGRAVL